MDLAALNAEITTDPTNLGYAAAVATGNDVAIAGKLNAVSNTIFITETVIDRDHFMTAIAPALFRIAAFTDALQREKWTRIINFACATDWVDMQKPSVQALLWAAVNEAVLTQDEVDGIGLRTASRAEALFGIGTVVTTDNVGHALRGTS